LKKTVEEGNYYEAHQICKTGYFRYKNQKKYTEAIELLTYGALTMLKYNQFNSGTELALLIIELYNTAQIIANEQSIGTILKILDAYPSEETAILSQINFIKATIKWSITTSNDNNGNAELNCRAARCYSKINDYNNAQRHYLRSNKPEEFADIIIKWSKLGYTTERDLFIARAVLQYLCLGNLRDSNKLFDSFIKNYIPAEECPQTPLINFFTIFIINC